MPSRKVTQIKKQSAVFYSKESSLDFTGWLSSSQSPPVEYRVKVKACVTAEDIWRVWQVADGTVVLSVTSLSSLSHFSTAE